MSRLDIFGEAGMTRSLQDDLERENSSPASELLEDPGALTKEQVQDALPPNIRLNVTDDLVTKLNDISMDPMRAEEVRSTFIGYAHVLKEGKYKLESYISACAYVSYKMMGYSNQDAYTMVFPDRVQRMRLAGKDDKHISAFVAGYHKNKLVNVILEQALIPSHVVNQDVYQQAIARQAYLMMNASSEKVQCDAANSLLNALKPPETSKLELEISTKDTSGIDELRTLMTEVAENQRDQIRGGRSTKSIAHQDIVTIEG